MQLRQGGGCQFNSDGDHDCDEAMSNGTDKSLYLANEKTQESGSVPDWALAETLLSFIAFTLSIAPIWSNIGERTFRQELFSGQI